MLIELTEEYIPEHFFFREQEEEKIKSIFRQFKVFNFSTNLFICGFTGSGKTSMIKKIIKEEDNSYYVSLIQYSTINKVFRFLSGCEKHSNSELINLFIEKVKKDKKILIIDEISKLKKFEFEEFFNSLNHIYRETNIPIIILSNRYTLLGEIPQDAKLTLLFDKLELPQYNPIQISKIIEDRLKKIKEENNINFPGFLIEYISAKTVREHLGSLRIAFRIVAKCILNETFTQEFVNKCSDEIIDQDYEEFIHNINQTERSVLEVILEEVEVDKEISISTISNKLKIHNISPFRVSQVVSSFVDKGIIMTKTKNLGRAGGKYRTISIANENFKDKLLKILNPWM